MLYRGGCHSSADQRGQQLHGEQVAADFSIGLDVPSLGHTANAVHD